MLPSEIASKLAEPFSADEIKWKPAVVSGNRALALAYVDARVIQDRLDEVMGVTGWQDDYEVLQDGSVLCRLRLKIESEWLTKVDVGGPSEQPDGGDRLKAAFSDALKRAATKWGIGRFLYRLPQQWVDYDSQKRQFSKRPTLPASFGKPAEAKKVEDKPAAKEEPETPKQKATKKLREAVPNGFDEYSKAWNALSNKERGLVDRTEHEAMKVEAAKVKAKVNHAVAS